MGELREQRVMTQAEIAFEAEPDRDRASRASICRLPHWDRVGK